MVLRPPENTGSKAGAQTYALPFVNTEFAIAIDADTVLAADAIEKLFDAVKNSDVAAACGYVLPRYVKSVWERGRYIEYMFAFTFFKPIQDHFGRPLISSGCFSIYRTDALRRIGGWSNRTLAEDMDLHGRCTQLVRRFGLYQRRFAIQSSRTTFGFLDAELRRWSHGFFQNVMLHWRPLLEAALISERAWEFCSGMPSSLGLSFCLRFRFSAFSLIRYSYWGM